MKRQAACIVGAVVWMGVGVNQAWAWGGVAHQAVVAQAVDTLPKQLKPFYKAHRAELPTLSLDATPSEDAPERRFALDRLLPFPFPDVPTHEEAFKTRFGAEGERIGRLPWLVLESYARLVAAFKAGDRERILGESDVIAGLAADLHDPLLLTDNADGQKTGQHGLMARFSVRLPEAMGRRLKLSPDAARYLDQPARYVFDVAREAYVWLDNLLHDEALARRGLPGYDEFYYEAFEARCAPLLAKRLSRAAEDAGSFWYSAWTDAGRPELK